MYMRKWILTLLLLPALRLTAQTLPAVGTSTVLGKVDGIEIAAKVQSPSAQATPLQIACVFEYTENDLTNPPAMPAQLNGMLHLDEALHGIITELRKSGRFTGHAFETLLITPPPGTIPAKQLLLVGLGDRNKFDAGIMETVGAIGMREALRLGVSSYSHASDLKDAGIDSPTAQVAENVVKGALNAYRTQIFLKGKKMSDVKPIKRFTLLAGPAFYAPSGEAIKNVIATYHN